MACKHFLKVCTVAQIIDAGATELYKEILTAGGNLSMAVEAARHPGLGAEDIYGEPEACEQHSELYFGPSITDSACVYHR